VGHDGKCAREHGHSYKVEVVLERNSLIMQGPKTGMVLDFGDLSVIVKSLIDEQLDHHKLKCTAEQLASYIFDRVQAELHQSRAVVGRVRVWETADSWAEYEL